MSRIRRISLTAACAGAALAAPAAHACSLAPFPTLREGVHLIATPTADTVLAGAAGMEYVRGPEVQEGPVYGQVVRVERLGGTQALPPGTDRVVLVPWGYGGDCRPRRYNRSAVWAQPGQRGLFWAGLRPREQWVDGLPTLDVTQPFHLPYPHRVYADDGEGVMSVDQAFDLIELLPLWDELQADAEAALQPVLRWGRENPELARRFPASFVLMHAVGDIRNARLMRIHPPLGGTYRFTVSVEEGAPRTFYARTRSSPLTEWSPGESLIDDDAEPPALDDPIVGYTLMLAGAPGPDALPVVWGRDRNARREGYVNVFAAPDSVTDGVQLWRGAMELGLVSGQFPADPVLGPLDRAWFAGYMRRADAGDPEEIPARFLLHPDGSVAMEQTSVLDDGRIVRITGERVSTVTIRDPD